VPDSLLDIVAKAHALMDYEDEDPFGGYAYLRSRGVTDEQIRTFTLGLGPKAVSMPPDTDDGARFNKQYRGTLNGNVVLPLYNSSGTLRGIETRLWEERKYSQYYLDGWKEDAVFLGLPHALASIWETGTVFLVEGAFDYFPVQRVFPNTLCPLTAKLTDTQTRFLHRYARNVVFLFDRDAKGIGYSTRVMEQYNHTGTDRFLVHQLAYPAKDPGALYEAWGPDRFSSYLRRQADGLNLYL